MKSEGDSTDAALVTLQRLLRGRAVQNYMFEGVQRREDLIQELKLQESLPGTNLDGLQDGLVFSSLSLAARSHETHQLR